MILVTGGTGLLGSYLIFELLKTESLIVATKSEKSNIAQLQHIFEKNNKSFKDFKDRIAWREIDLLDYDSVFDALNGVNRVYHCAAIVSYNPSEMEIMYKINVNGTANIVNACIEKKIEKLCYVSSIASLGSKKDDTLIDENTFWENNENSSNYSKSKYRAEMEVWRGIAEGLNAVIVNPSVILGTSIRKNGSSEVFNYVKGGRCFYTNGTTGFVYAKDVSEIMILLMNSEITGERFILSSENISWKLLFELIAIHKKINIRFKYASPILTAFAWRFAYVLGLLSGKNPFITKETARTSHKKLKYSNDKVCKILNFEFDKIDNSIKDILNSSNN